MQARVGWDRVAGLYDGCVHLDTRLGAGTQAAAAKLLAIKFGTVGEHHTVHKIHGLESFLAAICLVAAVGGTCNSRIFGLLHVFLSYPDQASHTN